MRVSTWVAAEWGERRSRPAQGGLAAAFVAVACACLPLWLSPFAMSLALSSSALALGWASGNRYKTGRRYRRLLLGSGIAPKDGALGKGLESLLEAAFHALLLSPPAILVLALWQRGGAAPLALMLSFLAAFLLSSAAGFLSSLLLGRTERLLSLYCLGAWLLPSSLLEVGHPLSPFFQAWEALGAPAPRLLPSLLGVLAELVLAALLFAAGAGAIAQARRRDAS
jgi:hypothetical protein